MPKPKGTGSKSASTLKSKQEYVVDQENKRLRFERLAESRIETLKDTFRKIGNLANKNNYSYTQEHINQIFSAIDSYVIELKSAFDMKPATYGKAFKFKKNKTSN